MNRCITVHEDAISDLHEHFNYLSQNSRDNAFLFFDSARQTFAALARMPGMGQQYQSEDQNIINICKWTVKGFRKYLIFYRYDDQSIEILRIIYASRDLDSILKDL